MKNCWLYLFLISLLPIQSSAKSECLGSRTYLVEGRSHTFCWDQKKEAFVSARCIDEKQKCEIDGLLKGANEVHAALTAKDLNGGRNPGSVLCSKLGGAVMYAKLSSGSEITFCEANDHSMIDCNALSNQ